MSLEEEIEQIMRRSTEYSEYKKIKFATELITLNIKEIKDLKSTEKHRKNLEIKLEKYSENLRKFRVKTIKKYLRGDI